MHPRLHVSKQTSIRQPTTKMEALGQYSHSHLPNAIYQRYESILSTKPGWNQRESINGHDYGKLQGMFYTQ